MMIPDKGAATTCQPKQFKVAGGPIRGQLIFMML
jgi:hypothetical protein